MATTDFTNGVTLSDAGWADDIDCAGYAMLTGVGGTANAITATGPATYSLSATRPPVWFVAASTNTGATTIAITPSGGSVLTTKNIFSGNAACVGGEIVAGGLYGLAYDGTQFQLIAPAVTRGSTSTTFTFNGTGGTSGAVTVTWQKIGQFVRINVPSVTATSGTGSTDFTSNTAIAAAARPAATQYHVGIPMQNNGGADTSAGRVSMDTSGIFIIKRDNNSTAFTNSSSCGTLVPFSFEYFVG